jgi:hypothetical protein
MDQQPPLETLESIDVEKVRYQRKKLSLQRLTFLFIGLDIILLVMVIIELIQWINRLAN